MTDSSPLAQELRRFSISTSEASFIGRCTPAAVSQAKAGGPIPRNLLDALGRLKVDTADLEKRQSEFRAARANSIEEQVQTRMMAGACNK